MPKPDLALALAPETKGPPLYMLSLNVEQLDFLKQLLEADMLDYPEAYSACPEYHAIYDQTVSLLDWAEETA